MAIANKTDEVEVKHRLTHWISARMPDAEKLEISDIKIPKESGLSNETILISMKWLDQGVPRSNRVVVRVKPIGPAVHAHYDLAAEFRLLETLSGTDIPVARPLWLEEDPSFLGAPFFAMEHITGRVPADDPPYTMAGWFLDLSVEERIRLIDNGLATLAAIHALDIEALGLQGLRRPGSACPGISEELRYLERTFLWGAGGVGNPTIEAALSITRSRLPPEQDTPVLNWGDPRIGNMLFTPSQSVAAVLDWELATVASAEMDVGWWLFMQRHHTEGIGIPLPAGIPGREETVERYQAHSGRQLKNVNFYESFAALRGAIQMHRVGGLMIDAGLVPADSSIRICNPANNILADLLGLPRPEGIAQTWVGNRG